MNTIILDDEAPAVRILEKYVKSNRLLQWQAGFTDPMEAFAFLQQHPVDLLLLDINMPELSGLALIRALSRPPLVIFTTAYPEYAVQGFEVEAVDYLVKPIAPERFLKAVEKAQRQFTAKSSPAAGPQHLLVKADRKIYRLPLDEIIYLQAYGDYVKIVCRDRQITPKEKLTNLEQQLPAQRFLRVHRSYIVALDKIEYMEGNLLRMAGHTVPVALTQREGLLEFLKF